MRGFFQDRRGSITLEFAICGTMFIGVVLGLLVIGLLIYNNSQVKQAARIAALRVAVTNDPGEAREAARQYLNKTLIACPAKAADAYSSREHGHGIAEARMDPLFPGLQKLIDPKGSSGTGGRIVIRREAVAVREYRFRPDSH